MCSHRNKLIKYPPRPILEPWLCHVVSLHRLKYHTFVLFDPIVLIINHLWDNPFNGAKAQKEEEIAKCLKGVIPLKVYK